MDSDLPAIVGVRWTREDIGYPWLEIDFADDRTGMVDWELKVLRMGYDAVFLGPSFESYTHWTLPADPSVGRTDENVLRGFTDDPRVLAFAKDFMSAIENGTFEPGSRSVVRW